MAPRGFNTYMEWERGFRGWLVVWFVMALLALAVHLATLMRIGHDGAIWWSATGASAWVVRSIVVLDIVWGITVFVALVYGLTLFLREDVATPRFWVRYHISVAIAGGALLLLHAYRSAIWRGEALTAVLATLGWWRTASAVFIPLVWGLYWMRSKRVRATYATRAVQR